MTEIPPVVSRLLKGSVLFFPLLWILFWVGTPLGVWGAMVLTLLLELLPAVALAQLPLAEESEPLPRVPVYVTSAITILVLGVLGLVVGGTEVGWDAMGLGPVSPGFLLLWSLVLTAVAVLLLFFFLAVRRRLGIRESRLLAQLIPTTGPQKVLFAFLSLCAGWGEEIAYRGFLIPVLGSLFGGVWPGAVLSSLAFGLLHAYQGWLGIFRTALLGFGLAVSFILLDTLWPAIVAHAILDVLGGLVLGKQLMGD